MPSFEDTLKSQFGDEFENRLKERIESTFIQNLNNYVTDAVTGCTKYAQDLNTTIIKIAETNKLNKEQIKRVAEEANVRVYLHKYAHTRGQKVRRVEFDLADGEKIASALGLGGNEAQATGGDVATTGTMAKAASYEDQGDPINFLNSNDNYEAGLWDSERLARVKKDIVSNRVLNKIAEVQKKSYEHTKILLYKIARIGDALISYSRIGEDPQGVFAQIVHDAGLDKLAQQPIKEYTHEKVAELKKAYRLPSNAKIEISFVDKKEKFAYELGEHSLLKRADDTVIRHVPPDVISDRGHLIQYDDLVELAREVRDDVKTHAANKKEVKHLNLDV